MKTVKNRKFLPLMVCAALIGGTFGMTANAVVPGVSPNIDPTLITDKTLPGDYDQGLKDGMPYGVFVVGDDANYSFGTATDSKGNLWYASFASNSVTVRKPDKSGQISLESKTETYRLGCSGLFAIAIDNNDKLIYSCQLDKDGYVARFDPATKKTERLITGLVRPNQMAVDANNNIYAVCENGTILRRNDADGSVDTLATGVGGLQSCCVDKNGIVYVLSYGKFSDVPLVGVAYAGGTLWQINRDGTMEVAFEGTDKYVWRARGLAVDDKGYVYITGEANAWDNGNSSNVVRYDPGTRKIENLYAGLDYGTFISYGSDGRFYQCLARDDLVIAYSEKADKEFTEQDWSGTGVRVISYGGSFTPSDSGTVNVKIGSLELKANASLKGGSGKLCGWIRVPCELVPEIDNSWTGSNDGKFRLPKVTVKGDGEASTAVMPYRTHTRARWPLPDVYTPAPDFRDNPEAYMVYFEWTPDGAPDTDMTDIYKNSELEEAGKAYSASTLETVDFTDSDAFTEKSDRLTQMLDLEKGKASCVTSANSVSFGFRIDDAPRDGTFSVSLIGSGGAGLTLNMEKSGHISLLSGENTAFDGYIEYNCFDGKWHQIEIENNFGLISVRVNGVNIPTDGYTEFNTEVGRGLSGRSAVLTVGTSSGTGKIGIRNEVTVTAEPIVIDVNDLPEETDRDNKAKKKRFDPLPIVVITAAVLAAAAAAAVVISSKKE